MKALAFFPKCDDALRFSSPYNGLIEAFEALGIPLHIVVGFDLVGRSLTELRSSSTERQIINLITELNPDIVITINNHGMTKRVRDAISVPVVKWLFDDIEHYFIHESFGPWRTAFHPEDIVLCYSNELRAKITAGCPYLRKPPLFVPHATSIDLVRAFPAERKHNISFIGSYLDVSPVVHFLQHFGNLHQGMPQELERVIAKVRNDPQVDIENVLAEHGLTEGFRTLGVRSTDFKRVLSDLITTRDRFDAVTSLADLGIALYGRNDWVLPLVFQRGMENVFQYGVSLDSQTELMKAYQSALITIDAPNVQNRTAIGGRVIEAMASSCLLITRHQEGSDLYEVFGADCPVPTYRDLAHLHALCEHYLRHSLEREQLVVRCNQLVAKGFDYKDRIAFVLGLAGLRPPAARRRVAANVIRQLEPQEPVESGADLDRLERVVTACVARGDFDEAMNLIIVYVQACWHDPGTLTKLFGSARLDELCLQIGRAAIPAQATDRSSTGATVYIASHLAGHGGHTRVLENAVRADTTARRVVLLTDLFNHAEIETFAERFGRLCEFRAAPRGASLVERLRWLSDQLSEIRPSNILLLNHHEDAVMIAAMADWLDRASVIFIHHADTNLCLGVHLRGATHVDLHNIGFNCCRHHEHITDNVYLPLCMVEKPSRTPDHRFMAKGRLTTCSSGSYNKFSARYPYSYLDLMIRRLQAAPGEHVHIGGVPGPELVRIRAALAQAEIEPDRFTHVPWVESVWTALVERNVDLYISSFPLSGGLATIEAMGSGTPILAHHSDMSRFHGGRDLMYPGVLTWRNAKEFEAVVGSVTAERLQRDSLAGMSWFEQNHSPKVMGEQLNRILSGRGAEMQPPPLQDHPVDRLEQYRLFAALGGGQEVGTILASMEAQKERVLALQAGEADRLRERVKQLTQELERARDFQALALQHAGGPGRGANGAGGPVGRLAAPPTLAGVPCRLEPGASLTVGALLVSPNGKWLFGIAEDGRLALRAAGTDGAPLWSSDAVVDAARLDMQFDGNLVLYDSRGAPLWASGTAACEGVHLEIRDHGTLAVTDGRTDAWFRPDGPAEPARAFSQQATTGPGPKRSLTPGAVMHAGERLVAPAGGHGLFLQQDGNLVLYRLEEDEPADPLWASDTAGEDVELQMAPNGALSVRTPGGRNVWSADAPPHPRARLEVSDEGAVLLTVDGVELWRAPPAPAPAAAVVVRH